MNIINHTLGFPRIGEKRELKKALENYWSGKSTIKQLLQTGSELRRKNWKKQKDSGIDILPVGDFAWYDHVLTNSLMLGNIPNRHKIDGGPINIDTLFFMSRGQSKNNKKISYASEMTKWFNTNYHYIVPEFVHDQNFKFSWFQLLEEIDEALHLGYNVKPIVLGPITYLYLGKTKGDHFNKLSLLPKIIPIYIEILSEIKKRGIQWVQIDEPILSFDLTQNWLNAFQEAYSSLKCKVKILLTTYFDNISHNLETIKKLPVDGIHIDMVYGKYKIEDFNKEIPKKWLISFGVINGRNIWKTNLVKYFYDIKKIINQRNKIWIGTSCSLLHTPVDLSIEKSFLNKEIINWFSFATQKCKELLLLKNALNRNDSTDIENWSSFLKSRINSVIVNNSNVQKKLELIKLKKQKRINEYKIRQKLQNKRFNLPIFPTTTIGSFPQTKKIRKIRMNFKKKLINENEYNKKINKCVNEIILEQKLLDLDVLVHGEPERNDMVEFFGEKLNGFVFTKNGWVQSYGSRCVKPPIIIGDIYRTKPITVELAKYSQSLTKKPVKGMLTGPVTILCWSFPREDLSKKIIANQIALAIREEVQDLEKAGIGIIQIDEPALREGLPLRKSKWNTYLKWAINAFRISSSVVRDDTQIHTHMCYCEFNDIIKSIADLDADVITIETSRSNMELLESFKNFKYPNSIGPGVYDIHSPNIPDIYYMKDLILKATKYIPLQNLWINPDCGLKTRTWDETKKSLNNMVKAAKYLRKKFV